MTSLGAGQGQVGLDARSGGLRDMSLSSGPPFTVADRTDAEGIVRMAIPLPDSAAHWVATGLHGNPATTAREDGVTLIWGGLASEQQQLAVRVQVDFTTTADGLVVRARIHNGSECPIAQVAFPQLMGLGALGDAGTRLQLPGRTMEPFDELTMRPDDVSFLETALQEYVGYGTLDMTMKWLDYGNAERGATLYSRDTRYTTQGLLVERPERDEERLNVRWLHYPSLGPGESWDSGDFVLALHTGDWHAGARAYQSFAKEQYPYNAPAHIRKALAIRSLWPAVRNSDPNFQYDELPDYAEEASDPDLGIAEIVLWHWWRKNGYPIIIDERMGSEADLRSALTRCRELGMPISLFVSHHILRDTEETDPAWVHHNVAGQSVVWNWTYGPDLLPKFGALYGGTHSMVKGSGLSPGWRDTGLAEYRRIMDLGASSICFDVFYAWPEPNFNTAADGNPDEEGEKLLEFARHARDIIHRENPQGTFSGEWPSDLKVPVVDYTWDWRNGFDVASAAPFRYVFPQFRLNANVGAHPRGSLLAFMEGALLNVMPGDMHSHRLADHPQLVEVLRQLNVLRRRLLRYFTDGQYHHTEGLTADGCEARLYTADCDIMVAAVNPTPDPVTAEVTVDTRPLGLEPDTDSCRRIQHHLDGTGVELGTGAPADPIELNLAPDDLTVVEYCTRER